MSLEKEYQFFKDNREELLTKYRDRFIVILGEAVVGDYGSEMEAYTEAKKRYEVGTFLIQHCIADDEGSTQIFHSRVSFPANA